MYETPATLQISLNERTVGTLVRLVDETIVFAFDPQYEADENRPILSLSFKGPMNTLVRGRAKTGTRLNPFFSNLLPEGHLREYLARKLGINSSREFYLLGGLGLDLPGAVTAIPLGDFSRGFGEASTSRNPEHMPTLRFSLAGVQLKFSAIAQTKGTFTIPADGSGGGQRFRN
jgi:serine/threonine-protein kinase HipA